MFKSILLNSLPGHALPRCRRLYFFFKNGYYGDDALCGEITQEEEKKLRKIFEYRN